MTVGELFELLHLQDSPVNPLFVSCGGHNHSRPSAPARSEIAAYRQANSRLEGPPWYFLDQHVHRSTAFGVTRFLALSRLIARKVLPPRPL